MDDCQQPTNIVIHNNIKSTKNNISSLINKIDNSDCLSNIEKQYYKDLLNFGIIATNGRSSEQKIQDLTEQLANLNKYIIENNLEIKYLENRFTNAYNKIHDMTVDENKKIHEKLSKEVTKLCDMLVKHTDHIRESVYDKMNKEYQQIRIEKDNNLTANRNEHIEIQKNILNIVSQRFNESKLESEQRFKTLEESNNTRFERVYDKIDKVNDTLAAHKSDITHIKENLDFLVKQQLKTNINLPNSEKSNIAIQQLNGLPISTSIKESPHGAIDIIEVLDSKKNLIKETCKLLTEYKWPLTMLALLIIWFAYNNESFANWFISLFK